MIQHKYYQKLRELGGDFKKPDNAMTRLRHWEEGMVEQKTGYMPIPCPDDEDMRQVDALITFSLICFVGRLLAFPHTDIEQLSPKVRAVIQESIVTPRITNRVFQTFRSISEKSGGLGLAHERHMNAGTIQDPYYALFYRVVFEATQAIGPRHLHPENKVGRAVLDYQKKAGNLRAYQIANSKMKDLGKFLKRPTSSKAEVFVER